MNASTRSRLARSSVALILVLAGLTTPAHAASGATASVDQAVQYRNDTSGTRLTFDVANTSTDLEELRSVLVARPSTQWTVSACAPPEGWSAVRTPGSCEYRHIAGAGNRLTPGTRLRLPVVTTTLAGSVNHSGTWSVRADVDAVFDGGASSAVASPSGRGLRTTIFAWQVLDAVLRGAPLTPGAACPPPARRAAAGSTVTVVVCGRNRTPAPATPVAGSSSIAGSMIASAGAFSSASVAPSASSVVLGNFRDAKVSSTEGVGRTVVARVGSSPAATSPQTVLAGYVNDTTRPAAPSGLATAPKSPSRVNSLRVTGQAEASSRVRVYTGGTCSGTPVATVAASTTGAFGAPLIVADNTTTSIRATATDAAANVSGCSAAVLYREDSLAPAAPVLTGTSPVSPSRANTVRVSGSAERGSLVRLFTSGTCAGTPVAAPRADAAGAFAATITVPADTTTTIRANATDAAGNVSACSSRIFYTEDSIAPLSPAGLQTQPVSPSSTSAVTVRGTAEPNSTARVFLDAACTGAPARSSTVASDGTFSAAVVVAENASTRIRADARDPAGNTSPCAAGLDYVEDSLSPDAPVLSGTTPSSPSSSNTVQVTGTAEALSTVRVYTGGACTGTPAGAVTANGDRTFTSTIEVATDATTVIRATSTDAARNASACSAGLAYVEDSTPPAAPVELATNPASPSTKEEIEVTGLAEGAGLVHVFLDAKCRGERAAQVAPERDGRFAVAVAVPADAATSLAAQAIDDAQNVSECSSSVEYVEDSTPPAPPSGFTTVPASPAVNSASPEIRGTAEAGATVTLHTDATCLAAAVATTVATSAGTFAATVSVGAESSTTFRAVAVDAVGHASGCSSESVQYRTAQCNPSSTTATNPRDMGSVSGDMDGAVLSDAWRLCKGGGSEWVRVRITEDSTADVYLSATAQLANTSSEGDIDLYVYCWPSSSSIGSSALGGTATDTVGVRADDEWGAEDTFSVLIEIRPANVPLKTNYTLSVVGNTAVSGVNAGHC